jgi:hypothetical protein
VRVQLGDVGRGAEANADNRGRAQQAPDALQPPHARHEPVGDLWSIIIIFTCIHPLYCFQSI